MTATLRLRPPIPGRPGPEASFAAFRAGQEVSRTELGRVWVTMISADFAHTTGSDSGRYRHPAPITDESAGILRPNPLNRMPSRPDTTDVNRRAVTSLSARAEAGREQWIHSCTSCHHGPGTSFGGTKADRPFEVLAAHAGYNAAYFKKYVRAPTSVMPGAKMQAHPDYTDEQLAEIIAFIVAEPKD